MNKNYLKCILSAVSLLYVIGIQASSCDTIEVIRVNPQRHFEEQVPAGNYSGITHIEGNTYAVVSDKTANDGFFIFEIDIDSISGDIKSVRNKGFVDTKQPYRDSEGIAYLPETNTLLISGEKDNRIVEYSLEGQPTGREAVTPASFKYATDNYGLESLTYSATTGKLWSCSESTTTRDGTRANDVNGVENHIRIQSFDKQLMPLKQYAYKMDAPLSKSKAKFYGMGISELAALDDGSLLVLEREFYTPESGIGAFVQCKLYRTKPENGVPITDKTPLNNKTPFLEKHLVHQWKTNVGLFRQDIANYEGMCLAPPLADGSKVLILLSDSQNQYAGIMKDWFMTIVFK